MSCWSIVYAALFNDHYVKIDFIKHQNIFVNFFIIPSNIFVYSFVEFRDRSLLLDWIHNQVHEKVQTNPIRNAVAPRGTTVRRGFCGFYVWIIWYTELFLQKYTCRSTEKMKMFENTDSPNRQNTTLHKIKKVVDSGDT